jgi:uncharacterized membrane protein
LFIMISSHYPATYGHQQSWLVLVLFSLAAVAVRHYFNIRHLPGFRAWPLIPALLLLVGLVYFTAPQTAPAQRAANANSTVQTSEVYTIIEQRCTGCHARVPSMAGFVTAPLGVELDSPQKLITHAERVYQTAVVTRVMPLANLTQMTDAERQRVAGWFENLKGSDTDH